MRSLVIDADGLEVGEPTASRLIHGVTDVVSRHGTLTTDIATFCHFATFPSLSKDEQAPAGGATLE